MKNKWKVVRRWKTLEHFLSRTLVESEQVLGAFPTEEAALEWKRVLCPQLDKKYTYHVEEV